MAIAAFSSPDEKFGKMRAKQKAAALLSDS